MKKNATTKAVFVKCRAKPGMFSDEVVATVGEKAFFVPRSAVQDVGPQARMKVQRVTVKGVSCIVIPSEYQEILPTTQEMELVEE